MSLSCTCARFAAVVGCAPAFRHPSQASTAPPRLVAAALVDMPLRLGEHSASRERSRQRAEARSGAPLQQGLEIAMAGHRDPEHLGLNASVEALHHAIGLGRAGRAYNARRQRVLKGRSPAMVVHEHLSAAPELVNPRHMPPNDPSVLPKALKVVARDKDVSHPDSSSDAEGRNRRPVAENDQCRRRPVEGARQTVLSARGVVVLAEPRRGVALSRLRRGVARFLRADGNGRDKVAIS